MKIRFIRPHLGQVLLKPLILSEGEYRIPYQTRFLSKYQPGSQSSYSEQQRYRGFGDRPSITPWYQEEHQKYKGFGDRPKITPLLHEEHQTPFRMMRSFGDFGDFGQAPLPDWVGYIKMGISDALGAVSLAATILPTDIASALGITVVSEAIGSIGSVDLTALIPGLYIPYVNIVIIVIGIVLVVYDLISGHQQEVEAKDTAREQIWTDLEDLGVKLMNDIYGEDLAKIVTKGWSTAHESSSSYGLPGGAGFGQFFMLGEYYYWWYISSHVLGTNGFTKAKQSYANHAFTISWTTTDATTGKVTPVSMNVPQDMLTDINVLSKEPKANLDQWRSQLVQWLLSQGIEPARVIGSANTQSTEHVDPTKANIGEQYLSMVYVLQVFGYSQADIEAIQIVNVQQPAPPTFPISATSPIIKTLPSNFLTVLQGAGLWYQATGIIPSLGYDKLTPAQQQTFMSEFMTKVWDVVYPPVYTATPALAQFATLYNLFIVQLNTSAVSQDQNSATDTLNQIGDTIQAIGLDPTIFCDQVIANTVTGIQGQGTSTTATPQTTQPSTTVPVVTQVPNTSATPTPVATPASEGDVVAGPTPTPIPAPTIIIPPTPSISPWIWIGGAGLLLLLLSGGGK